ncbi:hypothetical protein Agub_g9043, partial [Astrephomene gubernaculifera]
RTVLTVGSRLAYGEVVDECQVMVLLHEEVTPPGFRPTEAVMATDLSGCPLLCVLSAPQARLLAFSITAAPGPPAGSGAGGNGGGGVHGSHATPAPSGGGGGGAAAASAAAAAAGGVRVTLAGSLEALAVAAVAATGLPVVGESASGAGGSSSNGGSGCRTIGGGDVHRDLLVLQPSGQLVLHRGLSPLFAISLGSAATATSAATREGGAAAAAVPSGAATAAARDGRGARAASPTFQQPQPHLGGGDGGVHEGIFGGGAVSTPASQAGTDMMLDEDSDMEQDQEADSSDEEEEGGAGRGGRSRLPPPPPSRRDNLPHMRVPSGGSGAG